MCHCYGMKRHIIESNQAAGDQCQHAPFAKVKDGRKQEFAGSGSATGATRALAFEDSKTGVKRVRRVPLIDKDRKPVQTVAQAVEALNRLKVNRSDSNLPVLHRCPKFSDYVKTYLDFIRAGQDSGQALKRRPPREDGALKQWAEDLAARGWTKSPFGTSTPISPGGWKRASISAR